MAEAEGENRACFGKGKLAMFATVVKGVFLRFCGSAPAIPLVLWSLDEKEIFSITCQ